MVTLFIPPTLLFELAEMFIIELSRKPYQVSGNQIALAGSRLFYFLS